MRGRMQAGDVRKRAEEVGEYVEGTGIRTAGEMRAWAASMLDIAGCEEVLEESTLSTVVSEPAAAKKPKFKLQAKKVYLTFPHCDVDPASALARVREHFGDERIKWIVVCRELHRDGTPHLHCAIWLRSRVKTSSSDFFDFVGGQHGNYQVMRDPPDVVKYVTKEDDWVSWPPSWDAKAYVAARKKRTSTSFETVAGMVGEGDSIRAINAVHPGFMLQHLTKVRAYASFVQSVAQRDLLDWPAPIPPADVVKLAVTSHQVYSWIRGNVMTGASRMFGAKQLMVIGPTGIGKSTLIYNLARYLRIYYVPMGENFYDSYSDSEYDLIVFDEYRSQKTIQWMNSFVQGAPVSLRIKNGQVLKRKHLPVIVLTNYEPHDAYSNVARDHPGVISAYLRRFTVVRCAVVGGILPLYDVCDVFLPPVV